MALLIKIQLEKFVETLQIPWPKALSLVLLNLRSTLLELINTPFEIIAECSTHLSPASFDFQLIKGDIRGYCKDLIASVESNHAFVEQSFHSVLQGDEKSNTTLCNLGILFPGKDTSKKIPSSFILFLQYGTWYPENVLPGITGQKAVEIGRPKCWLVMISEKDLDQKGEMSKLWQYLTKTWTERACRRSCHTLCQLWNSHRKNSVYNRTLYIV